MDYSNYFSVLCTDSRKTSIEASGKKEQLWHTFNLKFILVYELPEENLFAQKQGWFARKFTVPS